jgi:8-oxo-dGTP diphosphatase
MVMFSAARRAEAAMRRRYSYDWPRPGVTVDVALFTVAGALNDLRPRVLLIERDDEPWRGQWALPGGFVRQDEDLPAAARRELAEEAGVTEVVLEQVQAVGTPGRDTRGHVITVVYVGLTAGDRHHLAPSGDARAASWFDVTGPEPLPALAFDHGELLRLALEHLRRRIVESPLCFDLLPQAFTLSELQALLEALLGRRFDRRNFRRKVQEPRFLAPTGGTRSVGGHRPAQLYRFVPQAFADYRARARQLPF